MLHMLLELLFLAIIVIIAIKIEEALKLPSTADLIAKCILAIAFLLLLFRILGISV